MLTCNLFYIRNYVLQPVMKERQAPSLSDGSRPLNQDQAPRSLSKVSYSGPKRAAVRPSWSWADRGQDGTHIGKDSGTLWWTESQAPERPVP